MNMICGSDLVTETTAMLAEAERPLIIYGSGILWSGAHQELLRFVEISNMPCLPTHLARGCVPDDHPLSCFTSRLRVISRSDVMWNLSQIEELNLREVAKVKLLRDNALKIFSL